MRKLWILSGWLKPDVFFLRGKVRGVGSWEWQAGGRIFRKPAGVNLDSTAAGRDSACPGACSCHLVPETRPWPEVGSEGSFRLALCRADWPLGWNANLCPAVVRATDTPVICSRSPASHNQSHGVCCRCCMPFLSALGSGWSKSTRVSGKKKREEFYSWSILRLDLGWTPGSLGPVLWDQRLRPRPLSSVCVMGTLVLVPGDKWAASVGGSCPGPAPSRVLC